MAANGRGNAWWREPMMWIVVGGPLSVVVASAVTAVIAWSGADTVLPEATAPAHVQALQPAVSARNRGPASQ